MSEPKQAKHMQRKLSTVVSARSLKFFLSASGSGNVDAARLASVSGPHSGAPLQAMPTEECLSINTVWLRLRVCARLGIDPKTLKPSCPNCQWPSSQTPLIAPGAISHHRETCRHNGAATPCHDLGVAGVCTMLRAAGWENLRVEPTGVYHESDKRPDIEVSSSWAGSWRGLLVDYSRTHPWHYVGSCNDTARVVREREKRAKYEAPSIEQGLRFLPFVVESYGAWSDGALEILTACSDAMAGNPLWRDRNCAARSPRQYWAQRLGVLFWKTTAHMVESTGKRMVESMRIVQGGDEPVRASE